MHFHLNKTQTFSSGEIVVKMIYQMKMMPTEQRYLVDLLFATKTETFAVSEVDAEYLRSLMYLHLNNCWHQTSPRRLPIH